MLMAAIAGIDDGALNVPRQLVGAAGKIGAHNDGINPKGLNIQSRI
jgi:hypothetical protein